MFRNFTSSSLTNAPTDFAILILRVFSGAFIMTHGIPKVKKIMAGDLGFSDPIGLGPEVSLVLVAFAETICGILIILGLGTRWASIPLIIAMFVAAFVAHATEPFGTKEKPLLFLIIFLVLLLTGSGKYSVDQRLSGS